MATLGGVFQSLASKLIMTGGSLYVEHLGGVAKEDLFCPLLGRTCYYVPDAITPYVTENLFDSDFNKGLLMLLACSGAYLFAARKGYSQRELCGEFMVTLLSDNAYKVIAKYTVPQIEDGNSGKLKPNPQSQTLNQKRAEAGLRTLMALVTTCVSIKLQVGRNPSLSLRPNLYYGAAVTLLFHLKGYAIDQKINQALVNNGYTEAKNASIINYMVSSVFLKISATKIVKVITGESVQILWQGEILNILRSGALFYLR